MDIDFTYLRATLRAAKEMARDLTVRRPQTERDEKRRAAQHWLRAHSARVAAIAERIVAAYGDAYEANTSKQLPADAVPQRQTYLDVKLRFGAVTAFVLSALCSSVRLNVTYAVPDPIAVAAGTFIATAIAGITYAFGHVTIERYPNQPQKALEVLEIWEKWVAAATLAGMGLFLGADLIASLSASLSGVYDGAVIVLAVTGALLAGLLLVTADLHGWSTRYARAYRKVMDVEYGLTELLTTIDPTAPVTPVTPAAPPKASIIRQGAFTTALVIALGCAAAPPAAMAQAATTTTATTARVFVDHSGSTDAPLMRQRIGEFFDLARAGSTTGIGAWELFRFYGQSFEAASRYTWAIETFAPESCPPAKLTALERVSAEAHAIAERRAADACKAGSYRQQQEFDARAAKSLERAKQALFDPTPTPGSCTALRELFVRISEEPARLNAAVLILSDGNDTCQRNRLTPIPAPKGPHNVVMVIVPAANSPLTPGEQFQARRRHWSRIAPWVRVEPGSTLGPDLFRKTN